MLHWPEINIIILYQLLSGPSDFQRQILLGEKYKNSSLLKMDQPVWLEGNSDTHTCELKRRVQQLQFHFVSTQLRASLLNVFAKSLA